MSQIKQAHRAPQAPAGGLPAPLAKKGRIEMIEKVERTKNGRFVCDILVDGKVVITMSHTPDWVRVENAPMNSGWDFVLIAESAFGEPLVIGFSVDKAIAANKFVEKEIGFAELKRAVRNAEIVTRDVARCEHDIISGQLKTRCVESGLSNKRADEIVENAKLKVEELRSSL